MPTPLLLPDLGSDRVTFSLWHVAAGESLRLGERVAEVLIPGAVVDISAPVAGVLTECVARPGEALTAGQVLGVIELDLSPPPRGGGGGAAKEKSTPRGQAGAGREAE